jgi:hypothetical protein
MRTGHRARPPKSARWPWKWLRDSDIPAGPTTAITGTRIFGDSEKEAEGAKVEFEGEAGGDGSRVSVRVLGHRRVLPRSWLRTDETAGGKEAEEGGEVGWERDGELNGRGGRGGRARRAQQFP